MENPRYFYLLTGLPFSGKTTLAQQISETTSAKYLSGDELVYKLFSNHPLSSEHRELSRRINERVACLYLSRGDVIYDAINPTREIRERISSKAKRYGGAPILIYVATPPTFCRIRLQSNKSTQIRSRVDEDLFNRIVEQYEEPDVSEPHIKFYLTDQIAGGKNWIHRNILARLAALKDEEEKSASDYQD